MKVNLVSSEDDGRYYFGVQVDGKYMMSFYDGEPEDNSLHRNFNDVFSIGDLITKAHLAGTLGEKLVIDQVDVDWDDL